MNINRIISRILAALVLICVLFGYNTPKVYANEDKLEVMVEEAMDAVKALYQAQYDNIKSQIKQEIKNNGYDYELTMLSFADCGNPYKSLDYNKIIAAYATIKEYTEKPGNSRDLMLSDAMLLTYLVTPVEYKDGSTYGDVTLTCKDPESLFEFFGIEKNEKLGKSTVGEVYTARINKISKAIKYGNLAQTEYVSTRNDISQYKVLLPDAEAALYSMNVSKPRLKVITKAIELIGEVPYQWGGKPKKLGYDATWWTFGEDGTQKGLDCSGYVQWVFQNAGFPASITDQCGYTENIIDSFEEVTKSDLLPGDLGLFSTGGLATNHVGIYIADGYWIHCSSNHGTVAIDKDFSFTIFVRPITTEVEEEFKKKEEEKTQEELPTNEQPQSNIGTAIEQPLQEANGISYTEDDVILLAKLIHHEAGNQGFNGWIGVGEVVVNRVRSASFPNTIREVVFAPWQFSYFEQNEPNITPSAEEIDAARQCILGTITVFDNNHEVMYFRNPVLLGAGRYDDWGKLKYYIAINGHTFYTR